MNLFGADQIYIINLDERSDRFEKIKASLKKIGIENFERFSAIRPKIENLQYHDYRYFDYSWLPYFGDMDQMIRYTQGAMGCKLSTVEVVKQAAQKNYSRILIFEDDASPRENFFDLYSQAQTAFSRVEDDFDVFYLGGNYERLKPIDGLLHQAIQVKATHAYILNQRTFNPIIENAISSGRPIDDYFIHDFQSRQRSYALKPGLFYQSQGKSDVLGLDVDFRHFT